MRKNNLSPSRNHTLKNAAQQQAVVVARMRSSLGASASVGPGKVQLLRKVGGLHSISAAARARGLTYKRAWHLLNTLNTGLRYPVVQTVTGGRDGGGAKLTAEGEKLVTLCLAFEKEADTQNQRFIAAFTEFMPCEEAASLAATMPTTACGTGGDAAASYKT